MTKIEYYNRLEALAQREDNGEDVTNEKVKLMQDFENSQVFGQYCDGLETLTDSEY